MPPGKGRGSSGNKRPAKGAGQRAGARAHGGNSARVGKQSKRPGSARGAGSSGPGSRDPKSRRRGNPAIPERNADADKLAQSFRKKGEKNPFFGDDPRNPKQAGKYSPERKRADKARDAEKTRDAEKASADDARRKGPARRGKPTQPNQKDEARSQPSAQSGGPRVVPNSTPIYRDTKRFGVIYHDSEIIVADKPAGMLTTMATRDQETLQDLLAKRFPPDRAHPEPPACVHRIDRETSGIVLFGRTADALHTLSNAFRDREVEKTYRALVLGEVLEELEIDAPLAARKGSKDRMLVSYLENSQEAHTTVTPLNTIAVDCAPGCVTEVELQPHTGRKHQLRVHLSHMKHPIVGDQLYGDKRMGRWFRERMGCDWMWLHASSVSFMHPSADENDDMLEFSSPLPKHWKEALVRLKLAERGSS